MKLLSIIGSRKTALLLLLILTVGLAMKPQLDTSGPLQTVFDGILIGGYLLILLSLAICLGTNITKFLSRSLVLMMFHVGLTALCAFAGLSMLTYGNWHYQLVEGGTATGVSEMARHGRLFNQDLIQGISLENTRSNSNFSKGADLDETLLYANLYEKDKFVKRAVLSINKSVAYRQTRYHISGDQGYAGILSIEDRGPQGQGPAIGHQFEMVQGPVIFPNYPSNNNLLKTSMVLPGDGRKYQIELLLNEKIFDATSAWDLRIPEDPQVKITYITDNGFSKKLLSLGEQSVIEGRIFRFDEVRRWTGVNADHDPYKMPVFYSAFVALLLIGGHYLSRVHAAAPFMEDEEI